MRIKPPGERLPDELFEACRDDAWLNNALRYWMAGGYENFERMLIDCVIRLAKERRRLEAEKVEHARVCSSHDVLQQRAIKSLTQANSDLARRLEECQNSTK
jgi:hypothetical protein